MWSVYCSAEWRPFTSHLKGLISFLSTSIYHDPHERESSSVIRSVEMLKRCKVLDIKVPLQSKVFFFWFLHLNSVEWCMSRVWHYKAVLTSSTESLNLLCTSWKSHFKMRAWEHDLQHHKYLKASPSLIFCIHKGDVNALIGEGGEISCSAV